MARGQVMTEKELNEAPIGTQVTDWEHDAMVKELPNGDWFYRDQPMRGNTPRGFSSEVVHRAYGPAHFLCGPGGR